jgi:hypothetical protein
MSDVNVLNSLRCDIQKGILSIPKLSLCAMEHLLNA